jgi:hypothetical protein
MQAISFFVVILDRHVEAMQEAIATTFAYTRFFYHKEKTIKADRAIQHILPIKHLRSSKSFGFISQ